MVWKLRRVSGCPYKSVVSLCWVLCQGGGALPDASSVSMFLALAPGIWLLPARLPAVVLYALCEEKNQSIFIKSFWLASVYIRDLVNSRRGFGKPPSMSGKHSSFDYMNSIALGSILPLPLKFFPFRQHRSQPSDITPIEPMHSLLSISPCPRGSWLFVLLRYHRHL